MADPILENRLLSRIQAGVDEAEVLFRARSMSAGIDEGETAVSLFFPDGGVWAEGTDSAPLMAAALVTWVDSLGDRLPTDPSVPLISNDPYDGGGTLCDLRMVAAVPMGEAVGWIAVAGHYPDLGGSVVGGVAPEARTIQEEGLRVPLTPLDDTVAGLLVSNSRFPASTGEDFDAQVAAVRAGQAWMRDLGERHGWDAILAAGRSMRERSRKALASARQELSTGTFVRHDRLDAETAGLDPRHLKLAVTVSESVIEVDFEGTDPLVAGPTNCSSLSTVASVLCGFRHLFPEIPACGFGIDDLEIRVPHGSLLDAVFPFPVGGTSDVLSDRVISLVIEAFSRAVHGRGRACDGGGGNVIVVEGLGEDGPFALRLVTGAGGGASGRGDGLSNGDAASRHSRFASIEEIERAFPVRFHTYAERVGTGGAGRYRGGDGTVLEVISLLDECRLSVYADRSLRGAGGHQRGGRGSTADVEVFVDGRWEKASGRLQGVALNQGDRIRIRTAGGGGYGHPYERAIRLLSEDVRSGRLSRKDAAKQHGVVYASSDARDYDSAKTFKLRSYRLTSSDVDDFLDEIEALED